MNRPLLVASLLAVSACSADRSVDLPLRSVLAAATEGVAVHDGARYADAGMIDAICLVDTKSAMVVGDHDLLDGSERVFDAHRGVTLAGSGRALFEIPTEGEATALPLDVDAIDGRLLDDGVAVLFATAITRPPVGRDATAAAVYGCGVAFHGDAGTTAWGIEAACDATTGFAVDRATGTAWIADGASLTAVRPDGTATRFEDADADLVAWDAADEVVVFAQSGGDFVGALHADGTVAWSVGVEGAVADLGAAGGAGLVVVSVATDAGGEIVVLGGAAGEQIVSHLTPEAPDVTFASDGLSLALATGDAVYFYDVDPLARPMDTPTTDQMSTIKGVGGGAIAGQALLAGAVILD